LVGVGISISVGPAVAEIGPVPALVRIPAGL